MIDNKTYSLIKELMPISCVDLIAHIGNRILLCKRNNSPAKGEWWIPGGRVLKGETLIRAVHRKAKEELGIEVVIERQIGTYDNIFNDVHTITTVYVVTPVFRDADGRITLDNQHSEVVWFATDKLPVTINPILLIEIVDSKI